MAPARTLRLVTGNVRLTPVDEQILEQLLHVVIAETEPDEVMPPVKAPGGWSQARREAFREVDRARWLAATSPTPWRPNMWLGESACGTAMHRPVGRGCGSLEKRVLAIGIDDDVPPAVALAAAKDGLDGAGISTKSTVELDISVKSWEQI